MDDMPKSNLYERDLYTSKDIDYIISKNIIEYDMKSAGWNLILYYNLLPKSKIDTLKNLSKYDRTIQIGIYQRRDREFAKELSNSFKEMRRLFFIANKIKDENVISVKKDAIFITGIECNKRVFGNVEFAKKNKYTSYHKFGNIEMYYKYSDNSLDIKGINNDLLCQHDEFMSFLKRAFKLLESNDTKAFIKFMKKYIKTYLNRELSIGNYRELNADSDFRLLTESKLYIYKLPNISEDMINNIDITYNYINYILPLMHRHYFSGIEI